MRKINEKNWHPTVTMTIRNTNDAARYNSYKTMLKSFKCSN